MNTPTTMKTLELVRGEHRFIIRYEPGCEEQVADDYPFDHFDAAAMSLQIGAA
jgi:hypothetical protein